MYSYPYHGDVREGVKRISEERVRFGKIKVRGHCQESDSQVGRERIHQHDEGRVYSNLLVKLLSDMLANGNLGDEQVEVATVASDDFFFGTGEDSIPLFDTRDRETRILSAHAVPMTLECVRAISIEEGCSEQRTSWTIARARRHCCCRKTRYHNY